MLEAYDARVAEASGAAQQPAAAGPAAPAAVDVEADPFGLDALLEQQAAAEAAAAAKKRQVRVGGSRVGASQVGSGPPSAFAQQSSASSPAVLPPLAAHALVYAISCCLMFWCRHPSRPAAAPARWSIVLHPQQPP